MLSTLPASEIVGRATVVVTAQTAHLSSVTRLKFNVNTSSYIPHDSKTDLLSEEYFAQAACYVLRNVCKYSLHICRFRFFTFKLTTCVLMIMKRPL